MRRLLVVGSALGASLSLAVGVLAGTLGGTAGDATERAGATWRPAARVAQAMPYHLDAPPPGVDVRVRPSTASLLGALGESAAARPALPRLLRPAGALPSGVPAAGVLAAGAITRAVPAGTAVLGGLGTHVSPSCSGTTDGNRVQVLYVREASTPSRYAAVLPALRSYAADVDDTFALSSGAGGRRVRWVQDSACVPVIPEVVVAAGTLTGPPITSLMSALAGQGWSRPDRKYLALADAATLCGIAETYQDDSPGSANDNNGGVAMYGRVDSSCWVAHAGYHSAPAHELMHMLGAVQPSAPHHTRSGHCTDESDAMCYDDGSGQPMVATCNEPDAEARYDCNHDDYYDPGPVPSGYLARAWNTAASHFLDVVPALGAGPVPAPAPAPAPPVTPAPRVTVTVGLRAPATAYVGAAVTVTATVRAAPGTPTPATQVVLQSATASGTWRTVATATAPAGSARFTLKAPAAGRLALRAVVPASATVTAARSAAVSVQVVRVPATVTAAARAGRPAVLTAHVVAAGRAVAGQVLTLQQRVGATTWRTLTRQVTDRAGVVSHRVRPTRPTAYRWVFAGSARLAPAVSRTSSAR